MASVVAKKKFGGKQEGAGRPKGSVARRLLAIREMSDTAMKAVKRVPLATMLKNMDRFDEEAEKLYVELQALRTRRPGNDATTKKIDVYITELTAAWSKWRECTLDAQKCALDASPFMHQRLSQATVSVTHENITKPASMTSEQRADYYNKLRLRPTSHEPLKLVLDNETGDVVLDDAAAD